VQGENKLVDADTPLSDFAGPTICEKNVSAVGSGGNKTGPRSNTSTRKNRGLGRSHPGALGPNRPGRAAD